MSPLWRRGAVCNCKREVVSLISAAHFYYFALVTRQNEALRSATVHAIYQRFSGKAKNLNIMKNTFFETENFINTRLLGSLYILC